MGGDEEAVFDLILTTRRPDRGRCRACTAANILLPAWYARRADAIEVISQLPPGPRDVLDM